MRKRILSCFLVVCWLVISAPPFTVSAAQKSNIIQDVQIHEETLTILCANMEETGEYTVQMDGVELPISTGSVDLTRTPVTVFCLVDTSGSISNFKMKLIQDTLLEISSSLGKEDSMVLATVDDQLTIGEPLLSAEECEVAINGIKSSYKDTNLYYGIVKSLERLSSDETYHDCRCLIVLSDGIDCQDNGFTEQEVMAAIQNARLPLYTVALVENYNEREGAKTLGSFARSSFGGKHFSTVDEGGNKPIRRDSSGTEFGRSIWESLIGTPVLEADVAELTIDQPKTLVRLSVQYRAGNNTYEDSVDLPVDVFPTVPVTEETESGTSKDTAIAESYPGQEDPQPESKLSFLWIVIAVLVTAGASVTVWMVLRKRKKKTPPIPEVPQNSIEQKNVQINSEREIIPQNEKYYHLYLTDIPHGIKKRHYKFPENHTVTFGRDSRSTEIVDSQDKKLSGTHFAIIAQAEKYCVRDEKSRNGTFLNGAPIAGKGWSKLESGDKIRAGSFEYRIIIEPEDRGSK